MSPAFFFEQWDRLKVRFGVRAMDEEFKRLCALEVNTMSEAGFRRFVDVMIGSRMYNKPPLLSEFREARLNEEKLKFQNDVIGAAAFVQKRAPEEMRNHLRNILSKEFGKVSGVAEALEVARVRLRIKKLEDL